MIPATFRRNYRNLPSLWPNTDHIHLLYYCTGYTTPSHHLSTAILPLIPASSSGRGNNNKLPFSWKTLATATFIATTTSLFSTSLCKSTNNNKGEEEATTIAFEIHHLLEEHIHRLEAAGKLSSPSSSSSSSSLPYTSLPKPSVASIGNKIEITFTLPQFLNISAAVQQLRSSFRGTTGSSTSALFPLRQDHHAPPHNNNNNSSSSSSSSSRSVIFEESSSFGPGGKATTIHIESFDSAPPSSSSLSQNNNNNNNQGALSSSPSFTPTEMTVEITQPTDTSQPATFLFRSPDPPLHLADIMQQVIGATTTPINNNNHHQENNNSIRRLPFRRHNLFLPPPQQHQQEDQDSTINDEFSQFGSVFDELQAMMDAFASQFSPLKEQYDNNDEESVGSYRKRKYKQFEDVPGSHNHHNNSNGKSATSSISQFDAHQRMMLTLKDKLENMGATVFLPNSNTITTQDKDKALDWGILAGYDKEKRMIEDTMLLPLQHGHVYDEIRAGTRSTNTDDVSTGGTNYNNSNNIESSSSMSSSRARAVLLEGPPGCGKTTAARVIASQASVPLIYIPLEAIASKWYGETEKKLASILKLCESFPAAAAARGGGGCIVFIDELDALATTRGGGDMHEATRRVLGVLLRHLDGFEGRKGSIVVGATNRKQDLDPALRSRFSATIEFPLPDELGRKGIIAKYAKHLKESELDELARVTDGMSGRDLRDVAEIAERAWASKVIRGKEERGRLPPMGEYLEAMNLGMRK